MCCVLCVRERGEVHRIEVLRAQSTRYVFAGAAALQLRRAVPVHTVCTAGKPGLTRWPVRLERTRERCRAALMTAKTLGGVAGNSSASQALCCTPLVVPYFHAAANEAHFVSGVYITRILSFSRGLKS